MLIDLTTEQVIDFAEREMFAFNHALFDNKPNQGFRGTTVFQIARSGETPRSTRLIHEYRRRIGNKTVRIYSDNPLKQKELSLIVANPFKFVDEHPFRH